MKKFFTVIKEYFSNHKKVSIAGIIIVFVIGYVIYRNVQASSQPVRYVLTSVEKGALISSISGTGQVSNLNQVDVKPEASGNIVSVRVKQGQQVRKGSVIAILDSRDAQKAVKDARINLESAQISLEKLKKTNSSSLVQSQNSLTTSEQSKQTANDNLKTAYINVANVTSDAFNQMPAIINSLNDIFYVSSHSPYFQDAQVQSSSGDIAVNYKYQAGREFDAAKFKYDSILKTYRALPRDASPEEMQSITEQTYSIAKELTIAVKDLTNTVEFIKNKIQLASRPKQIDDDIAELNSLSSDSTSLITKINSALQNVGDANKAIINAQQTITEKQTDLQSGTDDLDVRSSELSVSSRQNSLQDALNNLSHYTVVAPFDGEIAKLTADLGASAGPSTAIATVITKDELATITLNEIDVAKVRVGQKATLTFDAAPDLTITGSVREIDTLGTVTQGVVSYSVKISFDTSDDQIKPGMSVSAAIITDSKIDVLLVPNGAVKTSGNSSVVQVLDGADTTSAVGASNSINNSSGVTSPTLPRNVQVEIGGSNETSTEIISGLKEGDLIVTRTITASKTTAVSKTASPAGILGGGSTRTGGGAGRIPTR